MVAEYKVTGGDVPDLLATLQRVELVAHRTLKALQAGVASRGTGGLNKVHDEARDALDRARRRGLVA